VNTADDIWVMGNLVCPDLDTVLYLLSDKLDKEKWWGVEGDTFHTHEALSELGFEEPLMLGDRDRALHIVRTTFLSKGYTLTQATIKIAKQMGIEQTVLPMCDEKVDTFVETPEGRMHFQEFWVARKGEPCVVGVHHEGIEDAKLTYQILKAFRRTKCVVIGPSNPITSIGPILHVKGMRKLVKKKTTVVVSPLIGKKAVSGPAEKLMRACGVESSSVGVSQLYEDVADYFVIDVRDETKSTEFAIDVIRADTLMVSKERSISLAKEILSILEGV
jgi:LPPG:FO 2-phospho-L-lactate transferase